MATRLDEPLQQSISWEGDIPVASAGSWMNAQIIHHPNAYKGSQYPWQPKTFSALNGWRGKQPFLPYPHRPCVKDQKFWPTRTTLECLRCQSTCPGFTPADWSEQVFCFTPFNNIGHSIELTNPTPNRQSLPREVVTRLGEGRFQTPDLFHISIPLIQRQEKPSESTENNRLRTPWTRRSQLLSYRPQLPLHQVPAPKSRRHKRH